MIELEKSVEDIIERLEKEVDVCVDLLNDIGILTEKQIKASKGIIGKSKFLDRFEQLFRGNGYVGGELHVLSFEIKDHGWMYAVYDRTRIEPKKVKNYLEEFYKNTY